MLNIGYYPTSWSSGYITPIHKNSNIDNPNNYRGITVTNAIGKLFNKILDMRLENFLENRKLINVCQIGLKRKVRTTDHMFVLKTIIDKYCNSKEGRVFACFVDFQKAFDTVIHTGITKLIKMGVGSKFYNVIKSMYSSSEACVKLERGRTDFFKFKLG